MSLHTLAQKNDYTGVLQLLENELVDPNARDIQGRTIAHIATQLNDIDAISTYLNAGVDANIKDDEGRVSLAYASDVAIVELLLSAGCNPSIPDNDGLTPIDHVYNAGLCDIYQILLDASDVRSIKDSDNESDLDDNESLLDDNESYLDDNESLLDDNESLLDDNESLLDDNESLFDDNESYLDDNESVLDDNESVLDDNESCISVTEEVHNYPSETIPLRAGVIPSRSRTYFDYDVMSDHRYQVDDIENLNDDELLCPQAHKTRGTTSRRGRINKK